MKLSIPDHIRMLKPYVAGKPLEELEREYGITNAVKLASNENPLGPSPKAVKAIHQAVEKMHRYPNGGSYDLIGRLSKRLNINRENIVLGNGSDDIIALLANTLLRPGERAARHGARGDLGVALQDLDHPVDQKERIAMRDDPLDQIDVGALGHGLPFTVARSA